MRLDLGSFFEDNSWESELKTPWADEPVESLQIQQTICINGEHYMRRIYTQYEPLSFRIYYRQDPSKPGSLFVYLQIKDNTVLYSPAHLSNLGISSEQYYAKLLLLKNIFLPKTFHTYRFIES